MNTPKYLEIAELIRMDIFVKYTKANQLIPSIRRYAQIYNVNSNTVSHAFRLLEADNIIYCFRRHTKEKRRIWKKVCKAFAECSSKAGLF